MPKAFWRSPIFVLVCATTIILLAYGGRQSFGMFLRPVSTGLGWGNDITVMSLATGLQSLVYGLATPFVGAIEERFTRLAGFSSRVILNAHSIGSLKQLRDC